MITLLPELTRNIMLFSDVYVLYNLCFINKETLNVSRCVHFWKEKLTLENIPLYLLNRCNHIDNKWITLYHCIQLSIKDAKEIVCLFKTNQQNECIAVSGKYNASDFYEFDFFKDVVGYCAYFCFYFFKNELEVVVYKKQYDRDGCIYAFDEVSDKNMMDMLTLTFLDKYICYNRPEHEICNY